MSAHAVIEAPTSCAVLPVVGSDTLVPLVDGRSVPYANLDVAASAPALQVVADRVNEVLPLYASVHRGAGYLSQVSTALYEAARQTIGAFVGAREDDVTIVTRNTTDSLNLLAGCVPVQADGSPGRVLVLDVEHHANLLPWQRTGGATVLVGGATVAETLSGLRAELARFPYALVAVTGAANGTGESRPLAAGGAAAHDAGARVLLDGAQLVPHRGVSLAASDVDYVAFSGHKTYAPFGAGALVGRRDWLDSGTPYLAGGGAVRNVTLDGTTWQSAPARHEAGSPNVIGAVALASACDALAALEPGELVAHETELRARLVEGLEAIDGVRVVRAWADAVDPVGVVTFSVDGSDAGLVAAYLSAEHGIGVRDGRFCAHPLLARLGFPAGAIRASIGVGTTGEEIDRLVTALRTWVSEGAKARYEVVDGCWVVSDDPRPLLQVAGLSGLFATAAAGNITAAVGCGPAPA
ncbi:aminotransferase class V-fold PLP-dependent enzyme [Oerskovia rustica]|uniref:Aminotransferase class V-fold PLP-dependent enzyme n=1 Tax=Oerskovia rustica TaxID=2762237 RepID=A0ABR8RQL0_9CELL|nr:aminotransferase class V-fold PLP-dependent enzyme [Oerskovia rustica]MBD7950060.1 aminotransferase class V-fold PLP-dependent enzyme [Oerskovia rustica]